MTLDAYGYVYAQTCECEEPQRLPETTDDEPLCACGGSLYPVLIAPADFIARFGQEVPYEAVKPLVLAGWDIWSYAYGQEDNPDPGTFTTLDPSDLVDLDDDDLDDALRAWGPFATTLDS